MQCIERESHTSHGNGMIFAERLKFKRCKMATVISTEPKLCAASLRDLSSGRQGFRFVWIPSPDHRACYRRAWLLLQSLRGSLCADSPGPASGGTCPQDLQASREGASSSTSSAGGVRQIGGRDRWVLTSAGACDDHQPRGGRLGPASVARWARVCSIPVCSTQGTWTPTVGASCSTCQTQKCILRLALGLAVCIVLVFTCSFVYYSFGLSSIVFSFSWLLQMPYTVVCGSHIVANTMPIQSL